MQENVFLVQTEIAFSSELSSLEVVEVYVFCPRDTAKMLDEDHQR